MQEVVSKSKIIILKIRHLICNFCAKECDFSVAPRPMSQFCVSDLLVQGILEQ